METTNKLILLMICLSAAASAFGLIEFIYNELKQK